MQHRSEIEVTTRQNEYLKELATKAELEAVAEQFQSEASEVNEDRTT